MITVNMCAHVCEFRLIWAISTLVLVKLHTVPLLWEEQALILGKLINNKTFKDVFLILSFTMTFHSALLSCHLSKVFWPPPPFKMF